MVKKFKQGDIIYVDFDPQAGHEQKGKRPAVVVSSNDFNYLSNLVLAAPITHTKSDNIFRAEVKNCEKIDGYIMCDQIKMIDTKARKAKYCDSLSQDNLTLVLSIIRAIISPQNNIW